MASVPPATVPLPDDVAVALRAHAGRLGAFARRVLWFDAVPSTNDLADRAASGGAAHGTVVVADLQTNYKTQLGDSFAGPTFDPSQMAWYYASKTWPSDPNNAPWIKYWRGLDTNIAGRLGTAGMNDDYWTAFPASSLDPQLTFTTNIETRQVQIVATDQLGKTRNNPGDIGAIERASQ